MREGYKKTKLGVIPEDWEVKKLNNITDVRDGTHDSPKQLDDGIPFITSKNLKRNGIDLNEISYISEDDHFKISKRSEVNNGDILFGMIGTIGNPVIVNTDFEFSIKNVALIKFKNEDISNVYINNLLKSEIIRKQFSRRSHGGVQKFIALGVIRELDIPIPPIKEQKKIASILSSVDEHLEEVDGMIEDLKELKKGLMQKLLTGQYTLENGKLVKTKEFKKTRLGMIPKHWEIKKLDKIVGILSGYAFNSNNFNESDRGLPLIRIRDLEQSNIKTYYDGEYDSKYIIKKNDVLIGMDGEFYVVKWNNENALLNQRICKLETYDDDILDIMFLYYRIQAEIRYIHRITPATTVKHLSTRDIRNIKIPIPSIYEQEKISRVLLIMDDRIESFTKEQQDLQQLKKGLMQQLLTGKKRVKINN